jgi:hypothetical protein
MWGKEQIEANLANAWEYGKMIAAGAFPYTPGDAPYGKHKRGWWCSPTYCGAWNICPGKATIADGTDLTVQRTNS